MQTIIFLAGRSTRFWPLSEKSLWPFLGKSLLEHQMNRLCEGGLDNITFVGGHHNLEEVNRLFPKIPAIEQEDLSLGMRGALLSALPQLKDEPVCIVSGNDVIEPLGYKSLLKAIEQGADGALLAQRVKRYFPGGYLVTVPDSEGGEFPRIAGIMEKPGEGREPSDLVNIVAHVHKNPQRLLDILEETSSHRDDAYEVALSQLSKESNYVAVPYEAEWNAVKYPWHILDLTQRFLATLKENQIHSDATIHESAVINGPVIIEEGVRIMPHATVQGPCFIGRGTIVGNNSLVRDSIVGEKCVIGYNSEVARAHLHSHVWTHTTYIGDSVIGKNVAFGSGSATANFRLDEGDISSVIKGEKISAQRDKLGAIIGDDVRVGVHTCIAPGVKIGKGSFISTGTYVSRDVEDKKYVVVKEGVLEQRENLSSIPGVRS